MKISAIIFDLDGTVVDSEEAWAKAFVIVLKSLGADVKEKHPHTSGVEIKKNWERLITKFNIKTNKKSDELAAITSNEYSKLTSEVVLMDGAIEFIENTRNDGILTALATSSSWEVTDKIIQKFKLNNLFDYVTTGDEVLNNKPDPEIYILTADKMSLDPNDCLVIEDSPSGINAGKDAGMKVIAIDPTGEREDLEAADLTVEGFPEITEKIIDQL